jgi:tetratricopeptide (TPR) repeat protein
MQLKPRRRLLRTRLVILVMAVSALCFSGRLLGHGSQDQETRAETFLSQADDLYAAGNYEKAIDSYLKASQTAKKKTNLSRAYMGLSLCCFYLNETENAKKYILSSDLCRPV